MGAHRNYARFYTLLKKLPCADKETLVSSFTNGRTTSLREMSAKEYETMCVSLEEQTGWKSELKKKRSLCLKLMQQLGIDTSDWARVDNFCQHPRLAGKTFRKISIEELQGLAVKLRTIKQKGGLKQSTSQEKRRTSSTIVYIPIGNIAEN
nr:MAG TPA: Protein of unknown function (DUF1018) [Caudoviricetes sp.]